MAPREDLLQRTREIFETIPDRQDPDCAVPTNGCMDDYTLTASGFAWMGAYEARMGRNPQPYADRSRQLLGKVFEPMRASGSVCYYVVGSNPIQCDGDPAGLASGRVRIIGIGHGQENPNYGLGLMAGVASTCLGLYLAGQPCDLNTVDAATGLTWRQICIELLKHARTKTQANGTTFSSDCVNLNSPGSARVNCSDSYGYSPDLYPLHRFYVSKVAYQFEDFGANEFQFDKFEQRYELRQQETMYNRGSFWGLNRFVFYYLLANEAWPGGTLNAHYREIRQSEP